MDDDHKQSSAPVVNGSSPYSQPQLVLMRVLSECGFDLRAAMERADQTRSSTLIMRQSAARSRQREEKRERAKGAGRLTEGTGSSSVLARAAAVSWPRVKGSARRMRPPLRLPHSVGALHMPLMLFFSPFACCLLCADEPGSVQRQLERRLRTADRETIHR